MQNKNSSRITSIKIGLASPEKVLEWSNGEVTKSETINYKSLKPEKGGLFDEKIFGPTKDYECYCGKYKKVKHKGKVCESCGVEITESLVRRERLGHIALATPVAHIWMIRELPYPSKISLLLDISYKEVEQIIYFVNYIVLDTGNDPQVQKIFKFKEVIDLNSVSKSSSKVSSRGKLRKLLRIIKERSEVNSLDYKRASTYYDVLKDSTLPFSIDEVFRFVTKHLGIRFGIGAEAILELLQNLNLDKEYKEIQKELKKFDANSLLKMKRVARRLECIKWIKDSDNKPEWMIIKNLVVTPPDTRPIIQLDGGKFTTSDINTFYRKIIIRNERLKKVIELGAPSIILNNEKRILQESVDALFDNSSKKKPIEGKDKRPLKSLSEHLKGKQGLFRQNLLGKRVDYSGRSVIVVGPELKIYEVGIPAQMILKLFRPFIIYELIKPRESDKEGVIVDPYASSIKKAEKMILEQNDIIWKIASDVIKKRPVLLNRAPTLHRLGIQAFEPKLIDGKAIRLHPLVTTAFNADFDGDQMAVHVPLSEEAVAEARSILLASWHILGPKDGKPIITPTQDIVLGNYYLTMEEKGKIGEGTIFSSIAETKTAYALNKVHAHSIIGIPTSVFPEKKFLKEGILITTVGKIILNDLMPKQMDFINDPKTLSTNESDIASTNENIREKIKNKKIYNAFDKKTLSNIINELHKNYDLEVIPETMDKIKDLGFEYSTKSATTISAFDVPYYDKKIQYIKEADIEVEKLSKQFKKGLLTDDERYKKVVEVWTDVSAKVSCDIKELIQEPKYKKNSIIIMADSGARGNILNFTQLSGMRGLMSKSYNYDQKQKHQVIRDTIEIPIKHSFIEGLTISEYFNSSYGARKGMTDTAMKTSKSGYMTRKLVDTTQNVIVNEEDCKATSGIIIKKIVDTKQNTIIESLVERLTNRFPIYDIIDPKTNKIIVKANEKITEEIAKNISNAGIESVEVRSVLKCKVKQGVCQKCFGTDLTTNKIIEKYTAIGVIAAQSIGEPGTQLTMRTFHTGGVSGSANIAQGFERLKQLFDVIPPKEWERAIISEIEGVVTNIEKSAEGYEVIVSSKSEQRFYKVPNALPLRVKLNDSVKPGTKISEGSIDTKELLQVAGIDVVRLYILKEVQKVYRLQGIEIADKYIEIIIRQLTNKIQVFDPGETSFFVGEIVDINKFREENIRVFKANKRLASGTNLIFGLDEAPAKSDSFLSAASFQDTKKILTDAAVKGQIDLLYGLKENVIFGNLIPCGTGKKNPSDIINEGHIMYNKEY